MTNTSKKLHKCTGCHLISNSKCKIFGQSTAMMETMLVYRTCGLKHGEQYEQMWSTLKSALQDINDTKYTTILNLMAQLESTTPAPKQS